MRTSTSKGSGESEVRRKQVGDSFKVLEIFLYSIGLLPIRSALTRLLKAELEFYYYAGAICARPSALCSWGIHTFTKSGKRVLIISGNTSYELTFLAIILSQMMIVEQISYQSVIRKTIVGICLGHFSDWLL